MLPSGPRDNWIAVVESTAIYNEAESATESRIGRIHDQLDWQRDVAPELPMHCFE
ncbi:MAG: hypothetical protein HYZ27_12570 [Deltaproteobacteria bacterium]|nr:hypothetical protein [Deltaproteobacteria bacterium]